MNIIFLAEINYWPLLLLARFQINASPQFYQDTFKTKTFVKLYYGVAEYLVANYIAGVKC